MNTHAPPKKRAGDLAATGPNSYIDVVDLNALVCGEQVRCEPADTRVGIVQEVERVLPR
jgi:hypothetical protein